MQRIGRLLACALLTFGFLSCSAVSIAVGQSAPPPAGVASDKAPESEIFRSLDGRYTIALAPSQMRGFRGASMKTAAGPAKGEAFEWRIAGLSYGVQYVDIPPGGFAGRGPEEALYYLSKSIAANLGDKAKIASERSVSVSSYPGRELKIDAGTLGAVILRVYIVNSRMYQMTVSLPGNRSPEQEEAAVKPFDSFKLITEDEVAAITKKQIVDATPDPLPQGPVTVKAKSDAEDDELNGKVKSVLVEEEDKSGTWEVQGRKRSYLYEFNPAGNLTRNLMYDYKGNPSDITVYGYIDGARVSNSKFIHHEYNPPPAMAPPGAVVKKRDMRFLTRYEYQYDARGELAEKRSYSNDGSLNYREVHVIKGAEDEIVSYDGHGSPFQHSKNLLDEKGHTIEATYFNEKDGSVRDKYRYKYELDSTGNWIMKTTERLVTRDGNSDFEPVLITYRHIEYY